MAVPTILLGRLAVDNRYKGQKLGRFLLVHAMWRSALIASMVGAVALEVDVVQDDVLGFYKGYGFEVLKDNPLHLYLPIKTIEALNHDFTAGEA